MTPGLQRSKRVIGYGIPRLSLSFSPFFRHYFFSLFSNLCVVNSLKRLINPSDQPNHKKEFHIKQKSTRVTMSIKEMCTNEFAERTMAIRWYQRSEFWHTPRVLAQNKNRTWFCSAEQGCIQMFSFQNWLHFSPQLKFFLLSCNSKFVEKTKRCYAKI